MANDPILDIFKEEAREHLGALVKLFLDLEAAADIEQRRELIHGLFRHAHSLKGDAKVVGLEALKDAAQQLEDILDEMRDKPENVNREVIDRGLLQFDQVRAAFDAWQGGEARPPVRSLEEPVAPTLAPSKETPVSHPFPLSSEARGGRVEGAEPAAAPASEDSFTVRVPAERLDRLLNLVAEVRICQRSLAAAEARLTELRDYLGRTLKRSLRQLDFEQQQTFDAAFEQLRQIDNGLRKNQTRETMLVEELEADIREARLLPLAMLTDILRRGVRDLAQSLGKEIRYEVNVGRILLDKAVIEALKDPLLHMMRNAADHGIEPAGARVAAGKNATGLIRITAVQNGPLVRITVADDGRGIDFDRVRQHLRRTGELDDAATNALTREELAEFLFKPGFTTATRGEISGRGVGLDVVRNSLSRLHGHVELASSSPAGAAFVLTVPVTISTVRILTVAAGGTYYGVATASIHRTGRARRSDLREVAGSAVLPLNGRPIRWVHLSELVGVQSVQHTEDSASPYLLVTQQGRELAVAVDDLEDEMEVLLKPLGFPLANLPGVLGATIRANGAVQLVLDLTQAVWTRTGPVRGAAAPAVKSRARILVVDDSPTTRAVLRNVFTAAGFMVTTASDGIDALERLRSRAIDLVVSDVEMPRLNGFDLVRQVKSKFGIPVILVTGREKEEHRREGLQAGADAYVVKSTFQGEGLLEIVEQFV